MADRVLQKAKSASSPSGVKSSGQQKSFIGPTHSLEDRKMWGGGSKGKSNEKTTG